MHQRRDSRRSVSSTAHSGAASRDEELQVASRSSHQARGSEGGMAQRVCGLIPECGVGARTTAGRQPHQGFLQNLRLHVLSQGSWNLMVMMVRIDFSSPCEAEINRGSTALRIIWLIWVCCSPLLLFPLLSPDSSFPTVNHTTRPVLSTHSRATPPSGRVWPCSFILDEEDFFAFHIR